MNPYTPKTISLGGQVNPNATVSLYLPVLSGDNIKTEDWNVNYFGILGHNFEEVGGVNVELKFVAGNIEETIPLVESDAMLNASVGVVETQGESEVTTNKFTSIGYTGDPSFYSAADGTPGACNGTTMVYCDYSPASPSTMLKVQFTPVSEWGDDLEIGSIVYGKYYDMPVSPDLSYKIGFEQDGVKHKKTLGGSDMTEVSYIRNPGFLGKYVPFSPGKDLGAASPVGRRTWDINFSALKSEFTDSYSDTTGYLFPEEYDSYTESRRGNDFYNRFMKPTLGGQLPFIFQFNTDERSSSDHFSTATDYPIGVDKAAHFSVAKLRNRSINFSHKSHKFYDIKMKVVESW